jgi:Flp pilus assembly protein TadG
VIDKAAVHVYNDSGEGTVFGRISAKAQDARGANLVEFALALLLLLLILGGIADLGRAFHIYIAMTNGAREGARYGARLPCLSSDPDQPAAVSAAIIAAVAQGAAMSGVDLTTIGCATPTISPNPVDGCTPWEARDGSPLVVTVSCPFQAEMSGAPALFGLTGLGNFNMTASATMANFGNDAQYSPK